MEVFFLEEGDLIGISILIIFFRESNTFDSSLNNEFIPFEDNKVDIIFWSNDKFKFNFSSVRFSGLEMSFSKILLRDPFIKSIFF